MGIRARLLWIVALATLIPALLIAARFATDRNGRIAASATALSGSAASLSAELDDRISGTAQLLYGLARTSHLTAPDRSICSAFLSDVREEYPQYTGILTINPDGQLFCDSLRTGRELDLRDRAYFQRARAGGTLVLEPAFGRLTGTAVLQIVHPAGRGPDLQFMLVASLNLSSLALHRKAHLPTDGDILLVDTRGTVLAWTGQSADPRPGSSIAGTPLFQFASTAPTGMTARFTPPGAGDGPWTFAVARPRTDSELIVLVGVADSILAGPADERLRRELVILAVGACVLFAGVWLLADRGISRWFRSVTAMTRRLGSGDFTARIEPPHPRGELGELIDTLNRTASSLEQHQEHIEELNRRLLQSQKMEAVGQLTGGLAHDFNNLLTVVIGNVENMGDRARGDATMQRLSEETLAAAERGAELTRSLLAFARRQPLAPRPIDLGARIAAMETLLRRTLGDTIQCNLDLAADLPQAMVDPAQFDAALLNLVLNARDAMPRGGELSITAAAVPLDGPFPDGGEEVIPGRYVGVCVTDNGSGMAPDVLAKAFDPFFTTKEFGRGSGLGLSMVYGFVRQSGGHVRLSSDPGWGTVVRLYLPVVEAAEPADTQPAPVQAASPPGQKECILAVEDDDLVRPLVERTLKYLGYRVVLAENAQTALTIMRERTDIDLLFTDVVMPGLNGAELAEEARRLRPGLKVLLTSGYAETALVQQGRLPPGVHLLSKPYQREALAKAVRAALEDRAV